MVHEIRTLSFTVANVEAQVDAWLYDLYRMAKAFHKRSFALQSSVVYKLQVVA